MFQHLPNGCDAYRSAALAEGPGADEQGRLHLASCSRCRRWLSELDAIGGLLGRLGTPAPPVGFGARLVRRLEATVQAPPRPVWPWRFGLLAPGLAGAAALAAALWTPPPAPAPAEVAAPGVPAGVGVVAPQEAPAVPVTLWLELPPELALDPDAPAPPRWSWSGGPLPAIPLTARAPGQGLLRLHAQAGTDAVRTAELHVSVGEDLALTLAPVGGTPEDPTMRKDWMTITLGALLASPATALAEEPQIHATESASSEEASAMTPAKLSEAAPMERLLVATLDGEAEGGGMGGDGGGMGGDGGDMDGGDGGAEDEGDHESDSDGHDTREPGDCMAPEELADSMEGPMDRMHDFGSMSSEHHEEGHGPTEEPSSDGSHGEGAGGSEHQHDGMMSDASESGLEAECEDMGMSGDGSGGMHGSDGAMGGMEGGDTEDQGHGGGGGGGHMGGG